MSEDKIEMGEAFLETTQLSPTSENLVEAIFSSNASPKDEIVPILKEILPLLQKLTAIAERLEIAKI